MKVSYEVTEENYTDVIQYQLDSNKKNLPKTIAFYILTILFPILGIYLLVFGVGYPMAVRVLFLVFALIISAARFWRRQNTRTKAARVLKNVLQNGLLAEGFIGGHTLEITKGNISDAFGKEKLEVPCRTVTRIERLERITILFCGPNMFLVLPNDFLAQEGNGLLDELKKSAEDNLGKDREKQLSILPEDAKYKLEWAWNEANYVEGMTAAKRNGYLADKRRGIISIVFLLLSIGVLVYSILLGQYVMTGIIFIIALLMNRELILIYTPLAEWKSKTSFDKLRTNLPELYFDSYLYLANNRLYYVAFDSSSTMECRDIQKAIVAKGYLIIYFGMFRYVVVPQIADKVSDVERLLILLESQSTL